VAGLPIKHGKGVKVKDLLSPLLFELAIDPLQQILDLDIHNELLHKIRGRKTVLRTSFYVHDADVFVSPHKDVSQNLFNTLACF
jgi:hypothetical protein